MGAAAGAVSEKPIIMSEKSEETQELVLSALASNILFNHLEEAAVLNLVMTLSTPPVLEWYSAIQSFN